MLRSSLLHRVVIGSSMALSAAVVAAAPVLSIDFGPAGQALESGFTTMTQAGGIVGGISVAITGTPTVTTIARSAYVGSGSSLFRDFLYSNNQDDSSPNILTLTLSGLAASTFYDLQLWSGDTGNNNVVETIFTVGAQQETVTNSIGLPTGLDDANYTTTFFGVMSSASGVLTFSAQDGSLDTLGQPPRVNGFQLRMAVPEPASLALVSVALLGLGAARRRKSAARAA